MKFKFFYSQNVNGYVLLYPFYSPNTLQFAIPSTSNIQHLNGVELIEQLQSDAGETDEMNEGSHELSEESHENENGNEDGDEDGDEDVGEETGTDFWQSLIEYFGICEGSRKAFRIAILPRIGNVDYLPIDRN